MAITKAIIYTRVSTEEQTHGYSLDNQREKCIRKAQELGAQDYLVFEEAGVSGEVINRPALMDAITVCKDKSFQYFIATDPDRLSRDLTNLLVFSDQIEKKGAKLIFTDFSRDATPEGKLFYSIRGAVAEFEKALIKRRTTDGKLKKAREHKWTHWPDIYGYDYNDGEVTINEEQANVIRLIFSLGAEMGIQSIAERLALMGIESPRAKSRTWSKTTIRRIIANETYYTGKTHIRKYDSSGVHLNKYRKEDEKVKRKLRPTEEWIEMQVPAIIDESTFLSANRRIETAKRRWSGEVEAKFLLSGLLRCDTCTKTWHGHSTFRRNKRVFYYVCTNKSPGPRKGSGEERCPTNFVPCNVFDDMVWQMVRGFIDNDDDVSEFNAQSKARMQPSTYLEQIERLRAQLDEKNQEENALIERLAKETNPRLKKKIDERLDAISNEIDQIERIISELSKGEDETAATELDSTIIKRLRQDYPVPDEMTFEQRYEAIHALIKEIRVAKTEDGYALNLVPMR